MKNRTYSTLEQKLYKTPEQEAAFLSGAFQTVAMAGVSVGAGWILGVVFMLATDRYFSKPFRDDADMRKSNLKGWIAGFATSLAVMYGVNAAMGPDQPTPAASQNSQSGVVVTPSQQAVVKPL